MENSQSQETETEICIKSETSIRKYPAQILLVEDDPGDVDLTTEILNRGQFNHQLNVVDDGVKALEYLYRLGEYATAKRPNLIILDLNLPKKDGRAVLQEIKSHVSLRSIPVVVFTTSKSDVDIAKCYQAGANCYITKPREFSDVNAAISAMQNFWLQICELPPSAFAEPAQMSAFQKDAVSSLDVLLVEDDIGDAEYFQATLQKEKNVPIKISHVESLTAAINRLSQKRFDAILLDLGLPESVGLSTFQKLYPHARGTPIVVLTGLVDEKTAYEAIRRGAQDYLLKSDIETRTFWRVMRYAIERRNAQENLQRAHDELEVRVLERTSELSETNKQLQQEIQQRARAEKIALQSEARFKRLSDCAFEGVVITKDGVIIDANEAYAKMHGYQSETLIGMAHEALIAAEYQDFAQSKRESNDDRPFEAIAVKSGGSRFPVEVRTRSLEGEDESIRVAAVKDVSERKLLEELQDRTVTLKQSNEQLEQFASIASHDLKEPLRTIISFLQLLENSCKDLLPYDSKSYLDYAVDGAERMRELIDDLLSFSQITKSSVELVPVDTRCVFNEALQNLKERVKETKAEISCDGELPKVSGNYIQLVRVFQNILNNALKFQKKDVTPEITVSVKYDGEQFIFSIRDNGIGFQKDQAERIFRMFERLHTRILYPGSGIGLAACRKIIESHNGKIWAESEPGKGSTFYFALRSSPKLSLSGVNILVVDDAVEATVLYNHVLKRFGANVDIAANGQEGVEAATKNNFDIILMDIQMPVMDGIEATRALRAAGYAGCILALTGHRDNDASDKYKALGFTDYLSKDAVSVTGDQFILAIQNAMRMT